MLQEEVSAIPTPEQNNDAITDTILETQSLHTQPITTANTNTLTTSTNQLRRPSVTFSSTAPIFTTLSPQAPHSSNGTIIPSATLDTFPSFPNLTAAITRRHSLVQQDRIQFEALRQIQQQQQGQEPLEQYQSPSASRSLVSQNTASATSQAQVAEQQQQQPDGSKLSRRDAAADSIDNITPNVSPRYTSQNFTATAAAAASSSSVPLISSLYPRHQHHRAIDLVHLRQPSKQMLDRLAQIDPTSYTGHSSPSQTDPTSPSKPPASPTEEQQQKYGHHKAHTGSHHRHWRHRGWIGLLLSPARSSFFARIEWGVRMALLTLLSTVLVSIAPLSSQLPIPFLTPVFAIIVCQQTMGATTRAATHQVIGSVYVAIATAFTIGVGIGYDDNILMGLIIFLYSTIIGYTITERIIRSISLGFAAVWLLHLVNYTESIVYAADVMLTLLLSGLFAVATAVFPYPRLATIEFDDRWYYAVHHLNTITALYLHTFTRIDPIASQLLLLRTETITQQVNESLSLMKVLMADIQWEPSYIVHKLLARNTPLTLAMMLSFISDYHMILSNISTLLHSMQHDTFHTAFAIDLYESVSALGDSISVFLTCIAEPIVDVAGASVAQQGVLHAWNEVHQRYIQARAYIIYDYDIGSEAFMHTVPPSSASSSAAPSLAMNDNDTTIDIYPLIHTLSGHSFSSQDIFALNTLMFSIHQLVKHMMNLPFTPSASLPSEAASSALTASSATAALASQTAPADHAIADIKIETALSEKRFGTIRVFLHRCSQIHVSAMLMSWRLWAHSLIPSQLSLIWDKLTPNVPRLKEALKVGLSMFVASLLQLVPNASDAGFDNGFWAPLTVAFILSVNTGALTVQATGRLLGTALGAIFGFLLFRIYDNERNLYFSIPFLCLWSFLNGYGRAERTYAYLYTVNAFTAVVIVLGYSTSFGSVGDYALIRIQETTFGCLTAVLINHVLWPLKPSALMKADIVLTMSHCQAAVEKSFSAYHARVKPHIQADADDTNSTHTTDSADGTDATGGSVNETVILSFISIDTMNVSGSLVKQQSLCNDAAHEITLWGQALRSQHFMKLISSERRLWRLLVLLDHTLIELCRHDVSHPHIVIKGFQQDFVYVQQQIGNAVRGVSMSVSSSSQCISEMSLLLLHHTSVALHAAHASWLNALIHDRSDNHCLNMILLDEYQSLSLISWHALLYALSALLEELVLLGQLIATMREMEKPHAYQSLD